MTTAPIPPLAQRLLLLRPLIRAWIECGRTKAESFNLAYADLMVAFGLARAGEATAARELLDKAKQIAETFPVGDSRRILTEAYQAYAAVRRGDRAEGEALLKNAVQRLDQLPANAPHRGKGRALDLDGKADLEHIEGGRHAAAHFGGKGTEGRGRMVDDEDAGALPRLD